MSDIFRRGKSFNLSSRHLIRKDAIGATALIAKGFFEASSGSIIGSSIGLATNNSTLTALAILSGTAGGTVGGSSTISALGALIATLSGVATQNSIMLAVKLMTGNSSSGGGATSEELYNSKLAIAEVISKLKIITGTGAGYTISGNSGTLPITSLELSNLQSELIAELNKLKIRLVH